MAAAIPFVREIDIEYGRCDQVSPLIRRVTAKNPGPFTYKGTGTYIIGSGQVAVIDPGPLLDEHLEAILEATKGETITHVLITHTHLDHSPLAAPLKTRTGAKTYGFGGHGKAESDGPKLEEGGDSEFVPDHAVRDGDTISGPGWTFDCIHTPGHTSNHMCFALREENAFFSGDHIMGWSTTVVVPPDGNMTDYIASARKLVDRGYATIWPTHGPPVRDVKPFLEAYIAHRLVRENQILECLKESSSTITDMVARMYADVDKSLHPAAAQSVRAHLGKLLDEGRVVMQGDSYSLR